MKPDQKPKKKTPLPVPSLQCSRTFPHPHSSSRCPRPRLPRPSANRLLERPLVSDQGGKGGGFGPILKTSGVGGRWAPRASCSGGSRADVETGGFQGFSPERRAIRIHAGGRAVNSNSLAFLVTVLVLFMVLNSHQISPEFFALAGFGTVNNFLGHTELRVHVPPTISFATQGRLQRLRLQLALLDREFDDLDYDALRALDADNSPHAPSMSEEDINNKCSSCIQIQVQAQQGSAAARKSDGLSQPSISVSSTGSSNEIINEC
ncbi:hypothetical protein GUJ93_ZPchr0013g33945 [Zizania palustris]|uniref:RING-type E3 ubiquitin transferase n=1 Tax=Zizania palustris TaxID=103762 RepID=A0A8J5WX74_ZIZPA|nr:hypothetical protein GUJ93_ZPchr0013g33945 [Zizania palustris]